MSHIQQYWEIPEPSLEPPDYEEEECWGECVCCGKELTIEDQAIKFPHGVYMCQCCYDAAEEAR